MLKITGIFLFCASVWAMFLLYDASKRKNIFLLGKMIRFVEIISTQISYTQGDIFSIFKKIVQEPSLKDLIFVNALEQQKGNWTFDTIVKSLPTNLPNNNIFAEFLAGLGQTDVDGQMEHCNIYRALLNEKKEFLQQEYTEKGKLYRSLGGFFAAGLAVLLI